MTTFKEKFYENINHIFDTKKTIYENSQLFKQNKKIISSDIERKIHEINSELAKKITLYNSNNNSNEYKKISTLKVIFNITPTI